MKRSLVPVSGLALAVFIVVGVFGASQSCGPAPGPAYRTFSDTWAWTAGDWTRLATAGPGWREGAVSVYDAARRQWLLFGGQSPKDAQLPGGIKTYLADTWLFDGSGWTRAAASGGPMGRTAAAAAYDAATGEIVVFGGIHEVENADHTFQVDAYDDTWAWSGSGWTQLDPAASPPANRYRYWEAGYDAATRSVILYSPSADMVQPEDPVACVTNTSNGYTCPPQTWLWNGNTWTRLRPAHQPWTATLFEDSASGRLMAWGISESEFSAVDLSDRKWRWTGDDWVESQTETLPQPPRPHSLLNPFAATLYGSPVATAFAFGGSDCSKSNTPISLADTWLLTGSSWQQMNPVHSPPGRLSTYLSYDADLHEVLLWGGISATGCPLT